jgi:hypothetical protein
MEIKQKVERPSDENKRWDILFKMVNFCTNVYRANPKNKVSK